MTRDLAPPAANSTLEQGSTVLVVEDEVLTRWAVSNYLRGCGYRVLEAATGEEAQILLRAAGQIDVLFSDVDLGVGMNGFALATWTRMNYPNVRVILASGTPRMAASAGDLCEELFLHKPFPPEELVSHIERLLALQQRGPA